MKDFWAKVAYAHDIGRDNNDPPISSVGAGDRLRAKIGDEEYRKFIEWSYTWKGQLFYFLVCLFSPICILAIIGSIVFWMAFIHILG